MNRYVISVGGTGQHIALALTRLVRCGALEGLKLIALDPDNETKLPQLLRSPTPSLSGAKHPLQDGVVKAPFDIARLGQKTFEQLFVDADHPKEQELFQCLFDTDEASIAIHKGMYGTPCVGATVFAEGANGELIQNLLRPLASASQVFVCGSVVGGTGAGIIHKLIGEIRRYYHHEIYGIFMLPWFDVSAAAGKGAITPATITRNASHGIKYFYEHTIPELTASLLIGYPGTQQSAVLKKLTLGEGNMGENPHYLHLAAARAVVELPAAHTANRGVKAYGMIHDLRNEGWLLDATWETGYPLRRLLRSLRVQHNLLSFVVLPENRKKILDYYDSFLMGSSDSFKALDGSIKLNVTEKKLRRPFAERVLDRFAEIQQEVEFCVNWAQKIYPVELLDVAEDSLMNELQGAFMKKAESAVHWKRLQTMWNGRELPANPDKPNTGADVAQHHADTIFQQALKS